MMGLFKAHYFYIVLLNLNLSIILHILGHDSGVHGLVCVIRTLIPIFL